MTNKQKILEYYEKNNILGDWIFVKENISEYQIEQVIKIINENNSIYDYPNLGRNVKAIKGINSFERRKIHIICEVLGYSHMRYAYVDYNKVTCCLDCNYMEANKVCLIISKEKIDITQKKQSAQKNKRCSEINRQKKRFCEKYGKIFDLSRCIFIRINNFNDINICTVNDK